LAETRLANSQDPKHAQFFSKTSGSNKVGTFYVYAKDAHTKATKDKIDTLLQRLTERIVFQSQGFRALVGDFNATTADLAQFAIWREHGFRELQEIAASRWNQPIATTCKGKSTRDHFWISPELADKLLEAHVCDSFFPDHAVVYGKFADFGPFPIPVWFKPHAIPWDDIPQDQTWPPPNGQTQTVPQVFAEMESQVDACLRGQGKPGLLKSQRGRCTVETNHVHMSFRCNSWAKVSSTLVRRASCGACRVMSS
jgi:hypothetical protein